MNVRAVAAPFRAALEARGFVSSGSHSMCAPAGLTRREAQRLKQAAWAEALKSASYVHTHLKACGCCYETTLTFASSRVAETRAQAEYSERLGLAANGWSV